MSSNIYSVRITSKLAKGPLSEANNWHSVKLVVLMPSYQWLYHRMKEVKVDELQD
jgi:hypothetical protein